MEEAEEGVDSEEGEGEEEDTKKTVGMGILTQLIDVIYVANLIVLDT